MLNMAIRKKLQSILAVLFVSLVIVQRISHSLPISNEVKPVSDSPVTRDNISPNNGSRDDICVNKGKFCEIICKNNPSEGGKMCNCDAYALRSDVANHYSCKKSII